MQRIIQGRRSTGAVGTINDLLDRTLTGIDRQSGEKLNDANIIAQCFNFLIAGYETTSGLLSFKRVQAIWHWSARACIGRQFALQEATLVLAMILEQFELIDFANYHLETRQTLTIKPDNFHIKVRLRSSRTATESLIAPC